jgi:hypothetical protein
VTSSEASGDFYSNTLAIFSTPLPISHREEGRRREEVRWLEEGHPGEEGLRREEGRRREKDATAKRSLPPARTKEVTVVSKMQSRFHECLLLAGKEMPHFARTA